MKRGLVAGLLLTAGVLISVPVSKAEVKTQEKSQLKMEGVMGRMMGMFGGKAAKEGAINTVAVKGNRKITTGEDSAEIIDLGEQKIYSLDLRKKNYQVISFEEMRRRLREARENAAKEARQADPQPASENQMELDVSLKESGQKRTINGYDCREVVATITAREKGKTLEESGGMVMTSHVWLGPSIPAIKEIEDFNQRYAKEMELTLGPGGSAEQMAMALAMYPGMKDMMGKMQVESVNMQGTPILTEMTIESIKSRAQVSQEAEQKQPEESSGIPSVRGLGGMLGRRLARKQSEGAADKPKDRTAIITAVHELVKVETGVLESDLAIPAGFKEKK